MGLGRALEDVLSGRRSYDDLESGEQEVAKAVMRLRRTGNRLTPCLAGSEEVAQGGAKWH